MAFLTRHRKREVDSSSDEDDTDEDCMERSELRALRSFPIYASMSRDPMQNYRLGINSRITISSKYREVCIPVSINYSSRSDAVTARTCASRTTMCTSMCFLDPVYCNCTVEIDPDVVDGALDLVNKSTKSVDGELGNKKCKAKRSFDKVMGREVVKGRLALLAADFVEPMQPRVSYVNMIRGRLFFTTVSPNGVLYHKITDKTLAMVDVAFKSASKDPEFAGLVRKSAEFCMVYTCYGMSGSKPDCRLIFYPKRCEHSIANSNIRVSNEGFVQYSGKPENIRELYESMFKLFRACFVKYSSTFIATCEECDRYITCDNSEIGVLSKDMVELCNKVPSKFNAKMYSADAHDDLLSDALVSKLQSDL